MTRKGSRSGLGTSLVVALLVATPALAAPPAPKAAPAPKAPATAKAPAKPPGTAKPKGPKEPEQKPDAAAQTAPPAPAEPPPPPPPSQDSEILARAKARKLEGDKAMDKLRHADALAAYVEVYAIVPDAALLYNMGRALEALDRLPEALEKLNAFRSAAPPELLAKVPGLNDRIANLEKRVSKLTVKVPVEGARVIVRDAIVGTSPLDKPLMYKLGKADVIVEAEGYFPYRTSVELPGGGERVVEAKLESTAKVGKLMVGAPKTAVRVSIDGKSLGLAPVEALLAPGNHTILAQHAEHTDYETTVVIKAGETKSIVAVLGAPPVYKRWYFWTSLGAVVVAGTAVTIVALSEGAPDAGSIAPYQLTPSVFVGLPPISF